MKREVMEAAGLELYAEVGIILFVIAFLVIVVRAFLMSKREVEDCGRIPLDDGTNEPLPH